MELTQSAPHQPEMERVIETLSKVLSEARDLSEGFYMKGALLQSFSEGQSETDNSKQVRMEGAVPRLQELIDGLNEVNLKNRMVLEHIGKLV